VLAAIELSEEVRKQWGLDGRGGSRAVLGRVCAGPGGRGTANAGAGNRGATAPELRHRRLKTLGLDGTYEQWMRANNYQQPPHSN
jgi:hypothetical protein